jgi:hypothetical protein
MVIIINNYQHPQKLFVQKIMDDIRAFVSGQSIDQA